MRGMDILYHEDRADAEDWMQCLREALPGSRVRAWAPGAPPADYAVVWDPPQQLIDEQPRLKALFNTGAGVERLLQLRLPDRLPVVRVDDAGMAVQMAEYVLHALTRHFREMPAYEAQQAQRLWHKRSPWRKADFPVGVLGMGALGERVIRTLQALDYPVLAWSRTPRTLPGVACHHGPEGLEAFLRGSRGLVNLLPLTRETHGLLQRERLSWLRPGALVINVARGATLVEADLLALLDSGHVAQAVLDVFETEPLPQDHPFWRHPRVTLTPHISARTLRDESMAQIAGKILALERGEAVSGLVERARGY